MLRTSAVALALASVSAAPAFPTRRVVRLDGLWDFAYLGAAPDPVTLHPGGVPATGVAPVPGAFDTLPGTYAARGTAVYRTRVAATPGVPAKLFFEACSFYCAVYVDGVRVADHGTGYSPFWAGGIPLSVAAERLVEVVVDNRFNVSRAVLHESTRYDFWQYGGLIRGVTWHELAAPVALAGADVLIRDAAAGAVDVRIRLNDPARTSWLFAPTTIDGSGGGSGGDDVRAPAAFARVHVATGAAALPASVTVNVTVDGVVIAARAVVALDATGVGVLAGLTLPAPAVLWAPHAPLLRTLRVAVVSPAGGAPDVLVEPIGVRAVAACARPGGAPAVCINGVPTKLLGYSKHDAFVTTGAASWPGLHALDYALLKAAVPATPGVAPYFRLVHYPHADDELTAADRVGVAVWQESLAWGNSEAQITDPAFVAATVLCIEEMVNATFNHPSGVLFAFLNEGDSTKAASCATYEALAARYRALRVNGLVTWASSRTTGDVCLDAADVVSFNSYPAWYGSWEGVNASLATVAPTITAFADWVATHQPGKPFIMSEIGAGAVPGWRDPFEAQWSEEYQAALDGIVARTVAGDDRFAGTSIWQWSDGRTGDTGGSGVLGRPRAYNNKGVLDEYRRPKQAFDAVARGFAGAAASANGAAATPMSGAGSTVEWHV